MPRCTALLFLVIAISGSLHAADIQFVQTLHDKIPLYGTQASSPVAVFDAVKTDETVVVAAGQTLALSGTETAMDVLVRGTFRMLPGANLKVRTLTAVDGGTIEIAEPATLTIRNLPIELTIDPSQYGHGLLIVNGTIKTTAPSWRQSYCQLASEVRAGQTTLTLATAPRGWKAGDKLVLPDTRQPVNGVDLSAQTEVARISAISGVTVTLVAPVQFNHLGWRRSNATVGLLPEVANLTQPIVIQSETPFGIRGHVFSTAASHQDVEGVALVNMGRTITSPLHSTVLDKLGKVTRIGTNQIGRYVWHHHHLLGRRNNGLPWQFRFEHCSIDSSPKWGIAVHGSHFGLVNDCAVFNAAGCGIVTEDPWVYGNKITNNIVIAKQAGSGLRMTSDHGGRSHRNDPTGDFWHNRGGFGLSSAMNEITGNRAYCCTESFGMAGCFGGAIVLYKPSAPGVCPACDAKYRTTLASHMGYDGSPKRYPFVFPTTGNVAWSGWRGIETWNADTHPDLEKFFPGLTLVHCRIPIQLFDHQETVIDQWKVWGNFAHVKPLKDFGATNLFAFDLKDNYRFGINVNDSEFRGYDAAYRLVNDSSYTNFSRTIFECPTVIFQPLGRSALFGACNHTLSDCTFLPVNENLTFMDQGYSPTLWITVNRPDRHFLKPIRYYIRPWTDGLQYQVFHDEQRIDFAMPPIPKTAAYADWPSGVNSQRKLTEMNMPIFGDAVPQGAVRWGKFWAVVLSPK